MAERPPCVPDASIIGRWLIPSSSFGEKIRQFKDDFLANRVALIAPENLIHEVSGILHQSIFARHINAPNGLPLLDQFFDFGIPLVQTDTLVRPAFERSLRYGCSYYDAIYLEIASRYNYPFVHADQRLKNALNGRFPLEVWIEDY